MPTIPSPLLAGLTCLGLFTIPLFADSTSESKRDRVTDRTYVFCRAQWKYGLERDDYLNRWVDRPLFTDPSLKDPEGPPHIQYPSFARTQQIVASYGLDGMGLYPETGGRSMIYDHANRFGAEGFQLITELIAKPSEARFDRNKSVVKALETAASFRINGRLILIVGIADTQPIEYWEGIVKDLHEQFGERIAFVPGVMRPCGISMSEWYDKYRAGKLTDEDRKAVRDHYRQWARLADGLYFSSCSAISDERRRFDPEFYRTFVIASIKDVLAEPEFKGKLFGLSAYIGHENNTRFGYTRSCDGTKTLRGSLGTALEAQPDFINIPEWDEQNENTSIRPTVYNGTSTLRLMRYYMARERGEKLAPLADDRTELPNLVLSYRKLIMLGEKLEIELLNIPDSEEAKDYKATLTLETPEGKVVYRSPELDFEAGRLHDHTLTLPSETFADYIALRPRLEIVRGEEKTDISDGLHHVSLRATWNWDYKWVKQPLRDLMTVKAASLTVSEPDQDGVRTVTGSIEADEPLAYVEVLDDGKTVYITGQDDDHAWRENEAQYVFSLRWQSMAQARTRKVLPGAIRLEGANGKWQMPGDGGRFTPRLSENTLDQLRPGVYAQRALLTVPKEEIGKATLAIDLEDAPKVTLPLEQLVRQGIYGVPAPLRFNLVVSRYLQQDRLPLHLKREKADFTVRLQSEHPASAYQLQALGVSGRIYRSEPVIPGSSAEGNGKVVVFSETDDRAIRLKVPARSVPVIDYDFKTDHGSVLVSTAGRPFWGILGGFTSLATDRGGGESNDGSPFFHHKVTPTPNAVEAPTWVRGEEGGDYLRFNGDGQFISLPQGVTPRRAGYTVTMEIRPENSQRRQVLFRHASHYPGSLGIYLHNGTLKADFLNERGESTQGANSFTRLNAGVWSKVEIRFDQETVRIAVNGEEGQPIAIKGPGLYDTVSVVGGFKGDWFKGDLRQLRFDHHAPSAPVEK